MFAQEVKPVPGSARHAAKQEVDTVTETAFSRSGLWDWWKRFLGAKEVSHTRYMSKAGTCRGWLNAALISQLRCDTGTCSVVLQWKLGKAKYPSPLIVHRTGSSLSSSLSPFMELSWFFIGNRTIPHFFSELCHFWSGNSVISSGAVFYLFHTRITVIITYIAAGLHPVWQIWATFWESLFVACKDNATEAWDGSGWSKLQFPQVSSTLFPNKHSSFSC